MNCNTNIIFSNFVPSSYQQQDYQRIFQVNPNKSYPSNAIALNYRTVEGRVQLGGSVPNERINIKRRFLNMHDIACLK